MQPYKPQSSGLTTTDRKFGHETRDINPTGVYAFLIFLTIGAIVIFVVLGGVYKFANRYAEEQDKKIEVQSPWVKQQVEAERQEVSRMTRAYQAVGLKPSSKDIFERESQVRVARIREPRLQNDDVHDLQLLREAEDLRLNSYLWLDKTAGKVTIPIDQAMQMLVQRQPQAPAGAAPNIGTEEEMGVNEQRTPMAASSTGITRPSIKSSHAVHHGGAR